MYLKGKKVLVTGASGFIGSHLTERLLKEGADVSAFLKHNSSNNLGMLSELQDNKEIQVYRGDLKNHDSVRKAVSGKEVIFHLGALISIPHSYTDPREYAETNVIGTLNILQAAREEGIERTVLTSTSEVYGTAIYTPINEEHPLQAQSPYSASKISADKFAESFNLSYGLPVSIMRPFNTYGPRQSMRAIIPTIIFQALTQEYIKLGNLSPKRDFTYVSDTVDGFIKIAESDSDKIIGKATNVGSGETISIGEITFLIEELIGKKLRIESDSDKIRPKTSEVGVLLCDNSKARELIGWRPQVPLKSGLERTIEYIESNIKKYKDLFGAI
jgi:dTDP-glucose 4,6-dehydratase